MIKYPRIPAAEDVLFRELFINNSYVVDNGGSINGSPSINNGAELNGTDEYLTFPGNFFNSQDKITIEILFEPDNDYSQDERYFLLDDSSFNYRIEKGNNASDNAIDIELGGTQIVTLTDSTYSSYWNSNGKNHLVVAAEDGNTDVYLNGAKIVDGDATSWSPSSPTKMYLGSTKIPSLFFPGKLHAFNVYKRKYSNTEVEDRFNKSTFKEVDVSISEIYLPLRTYYNDGSYNVTPNLGHVGQDMIKWGNGTGSNEPSLLENNGVDFGTVSDTIINCSDSFMRDKDETQSYFFLANINGTSGFLLSKSEGAAGYKGMGIYLDSGNLYFRLYENGTGSGIKAYTTNDIPQNRWVSVCVTYDGSETEDGIKIYIDGERVAQTNSGNSGFTASIDNSANFYIGWSSYEGGTAYPGKCKFPLVSRKEFTPTQVKWLHDKAFKELNI